MRGSQYADDRNAARRGIIPAHAGLTLEIEHQAAIGRDHPRACGAHSVQVSSLSIGWGSSPRMRGSQMPWAAGPSCAGIIPAHAGLTTRSLTSCTLARDHPRACGAHQSDGKGVPVKKGSSPRMRGSLYASKSWLDDLGIIPAHAGLTVRRYGNAWYSWDHPRACGAHLNAAEKSTHHWGSSPRMRGSQSNLMKNVGTLGIIPAHAGLTMPSPNWFAFARDHPRACGAHHIIAGDASALEGSSPRMRGSLPQLPPA